MLIRNFPKYSITLAAISVGIFGYIKDSNAASILLVDQGLPTTNFNTAAGVNRSNVRWTASVSAPAARQFNGDTFKVGSVGETYRIDTITVWVVPGLTLNGTKQDFNNLGDFFSNISLFFGTKNVSSVSSGSLNTGSSTTSNSNIVINNLVNYPGTSVQYQQGTAFYNIWQVDFNNLNLTIDGGTTYYFGVKGDGREISELPGVYYPWFSHASNAALSGSPMQVADNLYVYFQPSGTFINTYDSATTIIPPATTPSWDKSSDLNFKVFGDQIPFEFNPGTGLIILGALFGVKKILNKKSNFTE